jgi:hypothetical protein
MAAPQKRNKRGDKSEKSQRMGTFRVACEAITAKTGSHLGLLAHPCGHSIDF